MPKRFERHARSAWEWGTPGSRRDETARAVGEQVVPEGKQSPGKKNRYLCKGAHWKSPHQPEIVKRVAGPSLLPCHWWTTWRGEPYWLCTHEEHCVGCGKVLRSSVPAEQCPEYHPMTAAERAEHQSRVTALRERRSRRRKQLITGKQGFRRKSGLRVHPGAPGEDHLNGEGSKAGVGDRVRVVRAAAACPGQDRCDDEQDKSDDAEHVSAFPWCARAYPERKNRCLILSRSRCRLGCALTATAPATYSTATTTWFSASPARGRAVSPAEKKKKTNEVPQADN
jgi:hypothetical protein